MDNQIEMMHYLETLRKKDGLTIDQLIEGIMPRRQYSRYLAYESSIPLNHLNDMLDKLNMTLFEFSAYCFNHIVSSDNYDEIEFWVLIQNGKYKKAYDEYYHKLINKPLKSQLAKRAVPLGMKLVAYKNNKASLMSTLTEMKEMINLDELFKRHYITDDEIISLYIYSQVCSDDDKEAISSYLMRLLDNGPQCFFVTNIEELQTISYIVVLHSLTTKEKVTSQDRFNIRKITHAFLEYHLKSKIANYDVKFFSILYAYMKRQHINNPHIVYYYILSILSNYDDESVEDQTFTIDKVDIEQYLALIQDQNFIKHKMYEGVKIDDL